MTNPPLEIARQIQGNLAHAVRRIADRVSLPRDHGFWLTLRLGGSLEEHQAPGMSFGRRSELGLFEVLETLEAASQDPRVDGVLLRITGPLSGFSKLLSLRRAILRLRDRGVPVAAYAEMLDAESLLVASAAERAWLPESGNVFLVGLRLESFFLRGALDRLGLTAEVVRIGRYKSAGESFTRDRMSPEARQQVEALADDLYGELVEAIAAGRGIAPGAVRDLIDRGPYHARAAVEAGLVDGCLYPDEVDEALCQLTREPPPSRPGPRRVHAVEATLYHAVCAGDRGWRPLLDGLPRIAYVVAHGLISRGGGHRGISSERYRELLDGVRRDERVRGVVLRVDSGGGDALASDLLWRSVALIQREKPVVVSMGDVVASGGYYLASAADEVLAEAGSVTGSIGVVGGKLNLEGLYERVGVAKDGVERGARAGLLSESRGFTHDEKSAVREEMTALYETFLDRVACGRGLSVDEVRRVAAGRVWSGSRARQVGLVDGIGGPMEALQSVRRRAGLAADERALIERHPHRPRLSAMGQLLRSIFGR